MKKWNARFSLGYIGCALAAIILLQVNPHVAYGQAAISKSATAYSSNVATEWLSLTLQLTQQTPGFSAPWPTWA
jgi:predicted secreted protein